MIEIPLYIWLMLSPIGRAEIVIGGLQVYFAQNEWCKKAQYKVVFEEHKVKIKFKCLWRYAGGGSNENSSVCNNVYDL